LSTPDVLLVNEFDYVPENGAANEFRRNYLQRGQGGLVLLAVFRLSSKSHWDVPLRHSVSGVPGS
jgi:hypothetical protein